MKTRTTLMAIAAAVGTLTLVPACNKDGKSGIGIGTILGAAGVDSRIAGGADALAGVAATIGLEDDQQLQQALGESVALAVTHATPLTDDQALNRYVSLVGLTLVSASDNPSGSFQFGVVRDDQPNAVSTPSGTVFISTGALKLMEDESELAGVLAHEVTHVMRKHGVRSIAAAQRSAAVVKGVTTVAGVNAYFEAFSSLTNVGIDTLVTKGYDRDTEYQADAGAVALCKAAGYDPAGLSRFLARLESHKGDRTIEPLSTHPGKAERLKKIDAATKGASGARMEERFKASVRPTRVTMAGTK